MATLRGLVLGIDGDTLTLGPLSGRGEVWRGHESVVLQTDADTIVLRHAGSRLEPIALADIQVGEPVWALAEPRRENVLRAEVVLVEGR
jgi:hypothetical protein